MSTPLPPYAPYKLVQERLLAIFPEGFEYRSYCTREIAASTVFAMLYVNAVASSGRLVSPKHVYRMSDDQAALTSDAERLAYAADASRAGFMPRGQAWYADNSRESIRDETLRQGFIPVGAAIEDKTVTTTSSKPRYALADDFAELFVATLQNDDLENAIEAWRGKRLSAAARARIKLVKAGTGKSSATKVLVRFPDGQARHLSPGKSSIISKAVIEEFATRFMTNPVVIWLSESGNKVVSRDDELARSINLNIDASKNLPDIILADIGDGETEHLLLVFVEVVATDGPISAARRANLLELSRAAKLDDARVAFVTAYLERNETALRKTFATLAWNTFVWLASEPENIVALYGESTSRLQALMNPKRSFPTLRSV